MSKRLAIVGTGFAGLWSALSAARLLDQAGRGGEVEIAVIAPTPELHVRPRLYEAAPAGLTAPLGELFAAVGVRFVPAWVEAIDSRGQALTLAAADGSRSRLAYDRLVLAAGSRLFRPPVPGLTEHAFSVDQLDEAATLEEHLRGLADRPDTPARNTVVVAGGGFTGIETAAELPERLRGLLGPRAQTRVIVVEQAPEIGPDLGPGPRPMILQALSELGVTLRLGVAVAGIDAEGVTLANGERIASQTVIWTAGVRASDLTRQIEAPRDALGRLHVDETLRVVGQDTVFAAGDTAHVAADADHLALMSCQHAIPLGRAAGHNAVADLLGLPPHRYSQPQYATCLDLGAWGAVFTEGWDRQVRFTGGVGKTVKRQINTQLIYPPPADRAAALAAADPAFSVRA
jgi:NADH dehydrogenase